MSNNNILPLVISSERSPNEIGDFDYIIDISGNPIHYTIYNDIPYYTYDYYKKYFSNCIKYVSIVTDKNNYLYFYLLEKPDDSSLNISNCQVSYSSGLDKRKNALENQLLSLNIPNCKVGYSSGLDIRKNTLEKKLLCKLTLLFVTIINGEYQEKDLHNYLKNKCSYCIMDYKYSDGTKATEVYRLHPMLINELYNYVKYLDKQNKNKLLILQENTKLEIEKTKQIEYVEKTKQIEYIEKTKQIEYIEKTKQDVEKTKQDIEKTKQDIEKTKQCKLELSILKLKLKHNLL